MTQIDRFYRTLLGCLLAAQCAAAAADEDPLVTFRSLAPETALEMAQAGLQSCRAQGFQVAVAVVDRMGVLQVLLRDRYAGPHTPDTARRLAWTAVSFRTDTLTMAGSTASGMEQSGARHIDQVLMIGGGIPVSASGSIVAGIGISGGPGSKENHACAQAGIQAVAARLELAD
jgi:uncharacterized protein GlcG (DUF336 family)